MTIPASKVRSLCTSSETAMVRASRKPAIDKLSHAELKQHSARARKLLDKWQGLGRGQSRHRRRQTGHSDLDANTQLKSQVLREALESFESRLAKPESLVTSAAKASRPKTKKVRSGGHRTTRAAVRKGMKAVEDLLNVGKAKTKPPTKVAVTPSKSPSKAASKVRKPLKAPLELRSPPKALPPSKRSAKSAGTSPPKRGEAIAAAKQSRVLRSGKTTRMFGHIASRGKRTQARRDAKG